MIYCEKHKTHTDEQCSKCVIEDREKKLVESSEYFKAMCLKYKELEAKLEKAESIVSMVMDNRNMPHKHLDYFERLCCLSERAREYFEGKEVGR